jgi:hypothetical protein
MNLLSTEKKSTGGAVVSSNVHTRLSGRGLLIARVVWLALVVPSLGLFVANLFAYDRRLQRTCTGNPFLCNLPGALTAKELQALPALGFSAAGYAALLTISLAIIVSFWCGIGLLIFWRRSDDWVALLGAFFLVMFSITPAGNNPGFVLLSSYPILALPISLVSFLGQISIYVFFLFFPNGRLVPRWMGVILLLAIIDAFLNNFPTPDSTFEMSWPAWLNLLVLLVLAGATAFSQIYRYRRVSTPPQRQQTKWIVLGVPVTVVVIIGLQVISAFIPSDVKANALGTGIAINLIFYVAVLLIPLSIGFSIMRYRLYDIDVLINRTLVYGSLTISLALIYVGLVIGLDSLVRLFPGQATQSPIVIVASTLAIAALFQPLRHRTQAIIDHRFYRRKYDAARIIAAFGTTLHHEVDLTQLSKHLTEVVDETMQPSHISLWLRPTNHDRPEPSEQF